MEEQHAAYVRGHGEWGVEEYSCAFDRVAAPKSVQRHRDRVADSGKSWSLQQCESGGEGAPQGGGGGNFNAGFALDQTSHAKRRTVEGSSAVRFLRWVRYLLLYGVFQLFDFARMTGVRRAPPENTGKCRG